MLIKFEKEIEHCMECPFKERVYEMGYSGYECSLLGCYATIPSTHIRKDCPFKKEQSEVQSMKILTDEEVALMIEHCYNEADERFCEICPLRKECSEA